MNIKIIKEDKTSMDVEIDNLTVVELLRVYLNKDSSVNMAVWKREHPSKNPVLHVEADNPKSVLKKAISTIQKELDTYSDEFKKIK